MLYLKGNIHSYNKNKGFSIVELMVAYTIFTLVLIAGVGSVVGLVNANRQARAQVIVIGNLNFAMENMARLIRTGSNYRCMPNAITGKPTLDTPQDCLDPDYGAFFAFEGPTGDDTTNDDQIVYRLNNNALEVSTSGADAGTWSRITSPNITVDKLRFMVYGSTVADNDQPAVRITLTGTFGRGNNTETFHLQTTVAKRELDI